MSYEPGPGFCTSLREAWIKRSELPKTHCGAEALRPSACEPTEARSVYALGPGEKLGVDSFAFPDATQTADFAQLRLRGPAVVRQPYGEEWSWLFDRPRGQAGTPNFGELVLGYIDAQFCK